MNDQTFSAVFSWDDGTGDAIEIAARTNSAAQDEFWRIVTHATRSGASAGTLVAQGSNVPIAGFGGEAAKIAMFGR